MTEAGLEVPSGLFLREKERVERLGQLGKRCKEADRGWTNVMLLDDLDETAGEREAGSKGGKGQRTTS